VILPLSSVESEPEAAFEPDCKSTGEVAGSTIGGTLCVDSLAILADLLRDDYQFSADDRVLILEAARRAGLTS